MNIIICKNEIDVIIKHLQDFIDKKGMLKGVSIAEQTDNQVVILVDDKELNDIYRGS